MQVETYKLSLLEAMLYMEMVLTSGVGLLGIACACLDYTLGW